MKPYSITRRVVLLVIAIELVAAVGITAFAFFYERHARFHSLDISLHGRADSVLGAVQEADNSKLGIMLDTGDLRIPHDDVFAVREENGALLGQSPLWTPAPEDWQGKDGPFRFKIHGEGYRGIRLHGVRVVDPESDNVRHSLITLYASPTEEVWEGILGAVQVFALANGLLVLLTVLLVPIIVRRSMNPLHSLALEAAAVTATAWHFAPTDDVRQVAELRPLVDAMEGVIRRLEHSFTRQRQFVGDAAHELKTAVAVVKSSIQLLELRARTAAEYEAGLQRCFADCLRMEDLAQKMLSIARLEEADTSIPIEPTPITPAIQAAVAELTPFATLRQVSILADPGLPAAVPASPEMLRSLLVNLLTNAIQHSPAHATVRVDVQVQAQQTGTTVHLRVEDSGTGIDSQALPFVFDRFYRGDPSRSRKTGGTGLGLAICKAIVERANGAIRIESTLESGTTVLITLPMLSLPTQTPPPPARPDALLPSSASLQSVERD